VNSHRPSRQPGNEKGPADETKPQSLARRSHATAVDETRLLPFSRRGWVHELVEASALVRLVKRHRQVRQLHWEVVVLQQRSGRVLPSGRYAGACLAYPPSERWGQAGWTFSELAGAHRRYFTEAQKRGVKARGSVKIADDVSNVPLAHARQEVV
jgi:hypothetical protein